MGQSGSYECDNDSRWYSKEYSTKSKNKSADKSAKKSADKSVKKEDYNVIENSAQHTEKSIKEENKQLSEGASTEIICSDSFPIEGRQGDLFFDTETAQLYSLNNDEWKLKKNLSSYIFDNSLYNDLVIGLYNGNNQTDYYSSRCGKPIVVNIGDLVALQNKSYNLQLFNKGCENPLKLNQRITWDDSSNKETERYVNVGDIYMVNYDGDYKNVVPITLDPMDLKEPITSEIFNEKFQAINPYIGYSYLTIYPQSNMLGHHTMYLYFFSDPVNTHWKFDEQSDFDESDSNESDNNRLRSKPLLIKTVQINMNVLEPLNVTINPAGNVTFIFTQFSGWLETNLIYFTLTNNNNYSVTINNVDSYIGTPVLYDTKYNQITEIKLTPKQSAGVYVKLTRGTPYTGGSVYSYIEFYGSFVNYNNAFICEVGRSLVLKENVNLPNVYFYQTPVESTHTFNGVIANIYNQDIKIGIADLSRDITFSADTKCSISFNGTLFDNTTTWEYTIPANTSVPFTMIMSYSGNITEPWIYLGASFRWTNKVYSDIAFVTTAIMYNE